MRTNFDEDLLTEAMKASGLSTKKSNRSRKTSPIGQIKKNSNELKNTEESYNGKEVSIKCVITYGYGRFFSLDRLFQWS